MGVYDPSLDKLIKKVLNNPERLNEAAPEFVAWLRKQITSPTIRLRESQLPLVPAWNEVGTMGLFGTNWTNYNAATRSTAAFFKDAFGVVHLKGLVTKSGTPVSGDVVFTLPEGYRPPLASTFVVATGEGFAAGRVRIEANGDVLWINGSTGETDFTSLDGINFRTT